MSPLRVGLIGFGLAGECFHAPWLDALEDYELTAVSTSREEAVHRRYPNVRVYSSAEALLADRLLDLVVVASPNASHYPLAKKALRQGLHVVVDKPMVTRAADAADLIRQAEASHRLVVPFHNRRWDNDYLTVCELLAQERLGEVHTWEVHFDRFRPAIKENWREEAVEGGGLLYDLGPHLIDQVVALFGLPEWVWADVQAQRAQAVMDDYFHLVLAWGTRRAILHAGTLVAGQAPRLAVHGVEGSYVKYGLDPQEAALRAGATPGGKGWGEEPEARYGVLTTALSAQAYPSRPGDYGLFYRELAHAVRGEGPPPVPAAAGLWCLQVLEAAQQSAANGVRVSLNG
ncbi:hypothetical protein CAI21_20575 [Alkalilimnicola ehrlichii]|uniref:Oxidoreductase domain protein n=1 Tax=Alkalilimnicola ehrlichii TaxID=351052 RepID=A0A3E0WTE4_9GAMM|nr:oxidoreductase [Alkalilimnicola ehrlichii]RFA24747.1 hypothetical protein CAI21_20575 [Alkalilimnicola ehrlichii]RFA35421.1 hypothetical protein CAL65_13160 [Alkalilimnicola ehrlichii]